MFYFILDQDSVLLLQMWQEGMPNKHKQLENFDKDRQMLELS